MAATIQAQRVVDALKAIGLTHGHWSKGGDFTVATDVRRIRDRTTGRRYSEFGDASASIQRSGIAKVEANADQLAAAGLSVILLYGDDKLVTAIVSSKYNPHHTIATIRNGEWSHRKASQSDLTKGTK